MSETPRYAVKATGTSLALLETLVEHGEPMGVTALADRVTASKSVVHNRLSTLRAHRYIIKQGGKYQPSLRPLALGDRTRTAMSVYRAARSELDNLAATDVTATLFGIEETEGVRSISPMRRTGGRRSSRWVSVSHST